VVEIVCQVEVRILDLDGVGELLGFGIEYKSFDEDDQDLREAENLLTLDYVRLLSASLTRKIFNSFALEEVINEVFKRNAPFERTFCHSTDLSMRSVAECPTTVRPLVQSNRPDACS